MLPVVRDTKRIYRIAANAFNRSFTFGVSETKTEDRIL